MTLDPGGHQCFVFFCRGGGGGLFHTIFSHNGTGLPGLNPVCGLNSLAQFRDRPQVYIRCNIM